jgi:hypothetical protein
MSRMHLPAVLFFVSCLDIPTFNPSVVGKATRVWNGTALLFPDHAMRKPRGNQYRHSS